MQPTWDRFDMFFAEHEVLDEWFDWHEALQDGLDEAIGSWIVHSDNACVLLQVLLWIPLLGKAIESYIGLFGWHIIFFNYLLLINEEALVKLLQVLLLQGLLSQLLVVNEGIKSLLDKYELV